MTLNLKIVAVLIGISLFVYIIELVRKKKLQEEYAGLWLITGAVIVVLSLWYDLLLIISEFFGILPSVALFFFGLLFLIIILLHLSVKISALTVQIKNLAQELAMLRTQAKKDE